MIWFDFTVLIIAFMLMRNAKDELKPLSAVIFGQLAVLLTIDVLHIDFNLYLFIHSSWFFIVKSAILFITVCILYVIRGHVWVTALIGFNMIYMQGMALERAFTEFSQLFHSGFTATMVTIMLLELIYLFGVSKSYDKLKSTMDNYHRRIADRLFRRAVCDHDLQNVKTGR